MKHYDFTLAATLIIVIIGAIATLISVKVYQKDDAPIEEMAELIVKDTTGIDIDFTPDSKEDE